MGVFADFIQVGSAEFDELGATFVIDAVMERVVEEFTGFCFGGEVFAGVAIVVVFVGMGAEQVDGEFHGLFLLGVSCYRDQAGV